MTPDRFKNIGLGILFLLVQFTLFRHLKVYKIQPDLVLIFLLWYASRNDRTSAVLMAAGFGFLQDAFLDLWGLNMFSKTLIIFMVYNFIPKHTQKRLLIGQVLLSVLIVSLIHNIIFLGLNAAIINYTAETFFWRHLIGNSCYTTLVAGIIYMFRTR